MSARRKMVFVSREPAISDGSNTFAKYELSQVK